MINNATVLVIGNGFDIEHDLPTKYTDFIDFIENVKESKAYKLEGRLALYYHRYVVRALGKGHNKLYEIITKKFIDNKEKCNWVDFEHEIQLFMKDYEDDYYSKGNKYNEYKSPRKTYTIPFNGSVPADIDAEELKKYFFRFRYAFELYISQIVNHTCTEYVNETILGIKPDIVISFNYSDTYERLYGASKLIHYIHGKADISREVATNCSEMYQEAYKTNSHIVFGMDEYFDENDRKRNTDFICFRKYFQRSSYLNKKVYDYSLADAKKIYIFGYSMNSEDADIIKRMIGDTNVPTTIYYYNEKAREDILTNLYKVFDREYIYNRFYRGDAPIELEQQGPRYLRSEMKEST